MQRKKNTGKAKRELPKGKDENIYLPYGKKAYIVQGVGLLLGIIGFIFVALGDITFSVISMVLGLVILIPVGLWMKGA